MQLRWLRLEKFCGFMEVAPLLTFIKIVEDVRQQRKKFGRNTIQQTARGREFYFRTLIFIASVLDQVSGQRRFLAVS
jgi:hypothetical protein